MFTIFESQENHVFTIFETSRHIKIMFANMFKMRHSCAWRYARSHLHTKRSHSTNSNEEQKKRIRSTVYYMSSLGVLTVGLSYAAVPLYKMFCQVRAFIKNNLCIKINSKKWNFLIPKAFSYGGTLSHNVDDYKVETMKPVRDREIKVHFTADTSSSMQWSFKPLQTEIRVIFLCLWVLT